MTGNVKSQSDAEARVLTWNSFTTTYGPMTTEPCNTRSKEARGSNVSQQDRRSRKPLRSRACKSATAARGDLTETKSYVIEDSEALALQVHDEPSDPRQ